MFCGTKFKETLFLRKMNLVLKGWAYFYHYNFGQNACYPLTVGPTSGATKYDSPAT